MGIITLGIGGKAPRLTYLTTSGLFTTGDIAASTIAATVYGPVATAAVYGPVATTTSEG